MRVNEPSARYLTNPDAPELPSGYQRTKVGIIPSDWDSDTVGNSFEVRNQLRLPLSQAVRERMAGAYPYYGPTSVQGWINEYRVEGKYALIGEDGDHFLKWRTQPMTLLVDGKFNVNNHAHLVRGTKNLTEWFYWFFANRDLRPYLTRQGAGRYKLTKTSLLQIPCALPRPFEQCIIAEALSDMDELLGALEALITKKRAIKQAAMQQLLTGKTRLPGFGGKWDKKQLGDFVAIRNQKVFPSRVDPETPCVELEHIGQGDGRLLNYSTARYSTSSKYRFFPEDVLFGRLRPYLRKFWHADRVGICTTEIWPLRVDRKQASSGFLRALVETRRFLETASISYGTHMPRADWAVMKNFETRLPCVAQQNAIATVLTDMDTEIAALEARRDKTRAIKQGMMQQLLTGRIRLVKRQPGVVNA